MPSTAARGTASGPESGGSSGGVRGSVCLGIAAEADGRGDRRGRPRESGDRCRAPYTAGAMTIGIMGLGYVGLPLAVAFAEEGHCVVALDTDARKIEALRESQSYVEDITSERLA